MPFPWKKAKGKRFSQLVSNHLQPPKRGSSLILETGFPASLADLFVKNRDCFNSYTNGNNVVVENKKKKKKRNSPHAPPISIPPPSSSPSPEPSLNPSNLSTPSRVFCVPLVLSPRPYGEDVVVVDDRTDCEVINGKNVSLMVLKMFFVVLIALCAKRFSVGIAISAFLLLFIEYVGRVLGGLVGNSALVRWGSYCLVGLLKRDEKLGDEAPIQVIRLGSDFEGPIQENKLDCDLDSSKGSLDYSRNNKMEDLVSGIDVVQPSPNLVPPIREIPSDIYEISLRNGKETRAEKVAEEVSEKLEQEECVYPTLSKLLLFEGKNERATRKSSIKSKIKKLANKLNGSKSKHKNKNLNESKCYENGKGYVIVTNPVDKERELEQESEDNSPPTSSSSSSSSGVSFDNNRVNVEESICSEDSNNNSKNYIEESKRERRSSSGGYLAILVIVLAGLVGGRVLALVFALSWFLILKFGSGTRLRCITN